MRIVFMGTPEFAVTSLSALLADGHEVAAVVTATDKPGGRGRKSLIACPVALYARQQGIPVLQPEKLRDPDFIDQLRGLHAELFVVVAFRMLPEIVWSMPSKGTINLHGSLLPAYRGAAPIHWAVLHGERETGVTIFFLQHSIDTGDILHREHIPIGNRETTGQLHDRMANIGARALVRALQQISTGEYALFPQPAEAPTHAPKIWPATAALDPRWPGEKLLRWVRGMAPYPGAWIQLECRKIKILQASQGSGTTDYRPGTLLAGKHQLWLQSADSLVEILVLQPEGRPPMSARDFLNGMSWGSGPAALIDFPSPPDLA